MYIDVSFPRPSSSPRLRILVAWLPIDPVLLTEPSHYSKTVFNSTLHGRGNAFAATWKNRPGQNVFAGRVEKKRLMIVIE